MAIVTAREVEQLIGKLAGCYPHSPVTEAQKDELRTLFAPLAVDVVNRAIRVLIRAFADFRFSELAGLIRRFAPVPSTVSLQEIRREKQAIAKQQEEVDTLLRALPNEEFERRARAAFSKSGISSFLVGKDLKSDQWVRSLVHQSLVADRPTR